MNQSPTQESLIAKRDKFVGTSSVLIGLITGIIAFLLGFTHLISVVVGLGIYGIGVLLFIFIPPIASLIRRLLHEGPHEVTLDLRSKLGKLDARKWILGTLYGILLAFGGGLLLPVAVLSVLGLLLYAAYWYFLFIYE